MTTTRAKTIWKGPKAFRRFAVPIASLEPFPGNPRKGDVAAIAESLERFGQLRPIVVDPEIGSEGLRRIVAGHHVTLAAESLGWTHVAVLENEFGSEDEARAFLLGDNRTSELGTIDEEALAQQIQALRNAAVTLEGTGYTARDAAALDRKLQRIRDAAIAHSINPNLDDVPDPPRVARSQPGEVYKLGPHRLICGESRDPATYRKLLGRGKKATMMWTDPPYGVNYEGWTGLTIKNDDPEGLRALLTAAFQAASPFLDDHAPFYIAAPAGRRSVDFHFAIGEAGWAHHQTLVWVKDSLVLGHSDYHFRHEDVHYGWTAGTVGRAGRGDHDGSKWFGDHTQTSVFEIPRPRKSVEHPTMKPVELVAHCIRNSTPAQATVLDPFAGSGTTMLAADLLGRRALLVELDPLYCDVIRARWERYEQIPTDQRLVPDGTQRMILQPTPAQARSLQTWLEILEVELGTVGTTATILAAAERLARQLNQGAAAVV